MVSAALTRHRRSKFIADESVSKTSPSVGLPALYLWRSSEIYNIKFIELRVKKLYIKNFTCKSVLKYQNIWSIIYLILFAVKFICLSINSLGSIVCSFAFPMHSMLNYIKQWSSLISNQYNNLHFVGPSEQHSSHASF